MKQSSENNSARLSRLESSLSINKSEISQTFINETHNSIYNLSNKISDITFEQQFTISKLNDLEIKTETFYQQISELKSNENNQLLDNDKNILNSSFFDKSTLSIESADISPNRPTILNEDFEQIKQDVKQLQQLLKDHQTTFNNFRID